MFTTIITQWYFGFYINWFCRDLLINFFSIKLLFYLYFFIVITPFTRYLYEYYICSHFFMKPSIQIVTIQLINVYLKWKKKDNIWNSLYIECKYRHKGNLIRWDKNIFKASGLWRISLLQEYANSELEYYKFSVYLRILKLDFRHPYLLLFYYGVYISMKISKFCKFTYFNETNDFIYLA